MSRIVMITGGTRSGKSRFAQEMALKLSPKPVYLATSRIWDEEHRARILRHQADRGDEWTNIEEEKQLSKHDFTGRVVLVDCVTLWLTNYFFDNQSNIDASLEQAKAEFARLTSQEATFIFVTNEIGMGGHATNDLQRHFTDLQGWMNQHIAQMADEVYWMVSGIEVKIKPR